MRRSSCIQNIHPVIKLPNKLKPIFELHKNQILQRIQLMIDNNALPTSLLLLTPKVVSKSNCTQNRTNLTLKLIKSKNKIHHESHIYNFDTVISNHNNINSPMISHSIKSSKCKPSQNTILEKVKKSILIAKINSQKQNLHYNEINISNNFPTLQPVHIKYDIKTLKDTLLTQLHHQNVPKSCSTSRPSTSKNSRNLNKAQKSQTFNKRSFIAKVGKKIVDHKYHAASSSIKYFDSFKYNSNSNKIRAIKDKIEDIPIEGWNIN